MSRDQRRLSAIVSLDVVGYSRLMGRDEGGTLAALKAHRRELIDPKIAEYGGRIVKTMGDGLLVEFPSVVDAVRCAVDVQKEMAQRTEPLPEDCRIVFRFGINVGDIIIDGDDIYGDGVNVAARLQSLADPGGIFVSRAVRDQVLDKLAFAFEDLGPREMKNIGRPIEVYRIVPDADHPLPKPIVPSAPKAMRPSRQVQVALGALIAVTLAGGAWFETQSLRSTTATIVPYSPQDRRMTFAVLPFTSPPGDTAAARIAASLTESATTTLAANRLFAVVVPRGEVDRAIATHGDTKALAPALDVHFLIRAALTPESNGGHTLDMSVADSSTDRVLERSTLKIPPGASAPARRFEDMNDALAALTRRALEFEVTRARDKPDEALDRRDLTFRARIDWERTREADPKLAYLTVTGRLERALRSDPDDLVALATTAEVNLCDCLEGWSQSVAEQRALGAAALEKFLRRYPESRQGQIMKAQLFLLRDQYEEAVILVDAFLARYPDFAMAHGIRGYSLLKLGRPREAWDSARQLLTFGEHWHALLLAASVRYALGDDAEAARYAQRSAAQMPSDFYRNGMLGTVLLTWIAAEARRGESKRAQAALATFQQANPSLTRISAIKAWMRPNAELAGYEPLFEGLRKAGIPD